VRDLTVTLHRASLYHEYCMVIHCNSVSQPADGKLNALSSHSTTPTQTPTPTSSRRSSWGCRRGCRCRCRRRGILRALGDKRRRCVPGWPRGRQQERTAPSAATLYEKYPYRYIHIHGYFVAIFPYFIGTGSLYTFVFVNRRTNEARAQ